MYELGRAIMRTRPSTMSNYSNQTTLWSCFTFYKIYQVIYWGIVAIGASVMRNGTRDEENLKDDLLVHV